MSIFVSKLFQILAHIYAFPIYGLSDKSDSRSPFKRELAEFFEFLDSSTREGFVLDLVTDIESKLILMLETAKTNERRFYEVKNELAVAQECVRAFADQEKVFEYILNSDQYKYVKDNTANRIEMLKFIRSVSGCGSIEAKNAYEADLKKSTPVIPTEGA